MVVPMMKAVFGGTIRVPSKSSRITGLIMGAVDAPVPIEAPNGRMKIGADDAVLTVGEGHIIRRDLFGCGAEWHDQPGGSG